MPTKLEPLSKKHARDAPTARNVTDAAGTVRVSVILLDPDHKHHQRGNITRHFQVPNARVSAVASRLAATLFKDGAAAQPPHITL